MIQNITRIYAIQFRSHSKHPLNVACCSVPPCEVSDTHQATTTLLLFLVPPSSFPPARFGAAFFPPFAVVVSFDLPFPLV